MTETPPTLFETRAVLLARPGALNAILDRPMRASREQFAHRMLWTLFADAPDTRRDFLFVVEREKPFTAIIRSRRSPLDGLGSAWRIDTHPFAPVLSAGQRLRFRVRAVASRSEFRPGEKRGKRVDVVTMAWNQLPEDERTPERLEAVAERAVLDWLASQGRKHGFVAAVEGPNPEVRVIDYDRQKFRTGRGAPISFGALTFEGTLTVTDPQAFRGVLATGLGNGRAFGNGLLQIASAPRQVV
jgi:CRISPR system Cascade subunit CasE